MKAARDPRVNATACIALLLVLTGAWRCASAQSCSATVTDVDFGYPNILSSTPVDVLATVTVTCTRIPFLTVVKLCPDIRDGSGGSSGSARLLRESGGATLTYQLFQDANRTLGWGAVDEPDLGTVPAIVLGNGLTSSATATRTIYARLFGGQVGAPAGSYASSFAGNETAFTHSAFFLGASGGCAGFVGTSVVRPAFDVVAVAVPYCTISTGDLDFGNVGVLRSAVTAQTNLRIACMQKTAFSVSLDGGTAGAAPTARKLASSTGESLTYGLYRDAARSLPWGDGATTRVAGTGTGSEQVLIVYGLVPAQSTPKPGVYADRIVATVTY